MDVAEIIQALGVIIIGYFTYNQYAKNKFTDIKVKKLEQDLQGKKKRRNDNTMIVFGELWNLLYEMDADRVYIVQPHPLGHEEMLTIYFEVKRKGVEPMREKVQSLKISEVAKFASDLVKNNFMYITNIDKQVEDRYAKAILSSCGCKHAVVKRLSDSRYDWVGTIFCEFTDDMNVTEERAKELMHEASTNIQYILPEFKN